MSYAEDRNYDRNPRADRSVAGLFTDLARETSNLVRAEVALAKTEVSQKVGAAAGGVVLLAAGGMIAFAGFLYLLASATIALSAVVAPWLAALIVGGVVVLVGVIFMLSGRKRLKPENLQPERTIRTLQDDKRWAQSQLSR
ncbi:phage holin family protein [Azospirillum halopraeferens]|uniref:phage holin family protein n=1 Tax=Azospirillum halopraeferens TaxID=34010 RepID=UPI000414AACF|nr:phage holin family protein [Azospirillum halopraeferens]